MAPAPSYRVRAFQSPKAGASLESCQDALRLRGADPAGPGPHPRDPRPACRPRGRRHLQRLPRRVGPVADPGRGGNGGPHDPHRRLPHPPGTPRRPLAPGGFGWTAGGAALVRRPGPGEGRLLHAAALQPRTGCLGGGGRGRHLPVPGPGRRVETAFPLERPEEFDRPPVLLATDAARNGRLAGSVRAARGGVRSGDAFLLATDAVARWILARRGWADLLDLAEGSQADWAAWLQANRSGGHLQDDDSTLLLVRVP